MKKRKFKIRIESIIGVLALIAIVAAWFIGDSKKQADLRPHFNKLIPGVQEFKTISEDMCIPIIESNPDSTVYISLATAHGYGGELRVVVLVNPEGEVQDFAVIDHKETHSFFNKVMHGKIVHSLKKTSHLSNFDLGQEIDGISGATYTSEALSTALGKAVKNIAENELEMAMAWEEDTQIIFGNKEILLIVLFILGLLFSYKVFPDKKFLQYSFLVFGMISLGFYYNGLLSITIINKFVLGMWPGLGSDFYGYLLIGGVILLIIFSGKNIYCSHVCPFGSAQKCLGLIGGTNKTFPAKLNKPLIWVQRMLALFLVLWALIAVNPSVFSYEVFGAFFQLYGTTLQFSILIVILILSLFFRKPWCNYLCPVRPVLDFIKMIRNKVIKLVK